ncbi:AAA family ATPase [Streptomyces sp. NPDC002851]
MALLYRDSELARMESVWGRCLAGNTGILLLEGAAGCGKTELLMWLCRTAGEQGALVLRGTGTAAEQDVDHGVLRQLTDGIPGGVREVSEAVTEAPPDTVEKEGKEGKEGQESAADPLRARGIPSAHEFGEIVRELAGGRPVVLCVDDLQYADGASIDRLLRVVRGLRDVPVLLALGAGPGGPAPYGAEARTELLRHPGFARLRVGRLDVHGTAALLTAHAGDGPRPNRLALQLHRITGGNPLLVKALFAEHPEPRGDQWPVPAPAGPFAQAVAVCLRRSGPAARRLAASIAVLGEDVTADLAAAVADSTPAAAQRAAEALDAAGLTKALRLRHPGVAAGVLEDCAPAERTELRLRAARALHRTGARAATVAQQLLDAPGPFAVHDAADRWAVPALREAARQALLDDDCGYAVGCLELARDLTADPEQHAQLTLRLAALLRRTDPAAAETELAGPLRALRSGALGPGAAGLLARTLVSQGRIEEAAQALEGAERQRVARTPYEDPLRPLFALSPEGTTPQDNRNRAPGSDRPTDRPPAQLPSAALMRSCAALWSQPGRTGGQRRQDPGRAAPAATPAKAASAADGEDTGVEAQLRDTPLAHHTIDLILQAVRVLVHTDRPARAVVWCQKLQAETDRAGAPGWYAALGLLHAQALLRLGDLKGAARAAAAAAEKVEGRGGTLLFGLVAAEVAALTAQGRYDAVARRLELPVPDELFRSVHALDYLRARGHYYLATHRHRAALGEFHDAGRLARHWALDRPRHVPWRTDAAAVLLKLGERQQAERYVAEQLASPDARSPRVYGISLRLRAALAPPAERPRILTRAVEELRRSGDRLEHARALADLGRALQLAGEGNRAGTMTRRAWNLAADCGAGPLCDAILPGARQQPAAARASGEAHTSVTRRGAGRAPAGRRIGAAYDRLSESERRIASLATLGYTNREISAKLYVTISTVEQHLTQVYRKLKISRRQELPMELQFDDLDATRV